MSIRSALMLAVVVALATDLLLDFVVPLDGREK
jgi:hypothetical protein